MGIIIYIKRFIRGYLAWRIANDKDLRLLNEYFDWAERNKKL